MSNNERVNKFVEECFAIRKQKELSNHVWLFVHTSTHEAKYVLDTYREQIQKTLDCSLFVEDGSVVDNHIKIPDRYTELGDACMLPAVFFLY